LNNDENGALLIDSVSHLHEMPESRLKDELFFQNVDPDRFRLSPTDRARLKGSQRKNTPLRVRIKLAHFSRPMVW
jgi:hypothetical protein